MESNNNPFENLFRSLGGLMGRQMAAEELARRGAMGIIELARRCTAAAEELARRGAATGSQAGASQAGS